MLCAFGLLGKASFLKIILTAQRNGIGSVSGYFKNNFGERKKLHICFEVLIG